MPVRVRPSLPLLLAIATAFGISSTIQAYFLQLTMDGSVPNLGRLWLLNTVYWYVPALSAPAILAVATRYRFGRVSLPAFAAIHLTGAASYAVLHTAAMLGTRFMRSGAPPARGWWFAARIELLTQLDWMFMTYLFLVGLAHALAYRAESERRTLDAAHLETRLVEAQLQSLQRQLRPHFLFNTLNTISGLMRSDVDAADRMMDKLGDLLRMTLNTSNVQEVTLREELELLQKYLDIEQTRFGSRLSVRVHVQPDALDARLPSLLLQPLVENAVRHGILPHARPGVVVVDGARIGSQLRIQVRDSGDGLPPDRLTLLNDGVGLGNTRARLQHLYRINHSLVFSNTGEGFAVTVTIPFVSDAAEPVRMGAA